MSRRVYSPEKVKLTILGKVVTGWTSITIDKSENNYTNTGSADGRQVKTANPNRKTGTLEVVVKQQDSEFYFLMAGVQSIIDQYPERVVMLPATVTDPSGGTLATLTGVWLDKMPTDAFSTDENDRTFMFLVDEIDYPLVNKYFNESLPEVKTAKDFINTVKAYNSIV